MIIKKIQYLSLLVLLGLMLGCEKESTTLPKGNEKLTEQFFEFNYLKSDGQNAKVEFTFLSIDSLKNYNEKVNFIPWFTENLGIPDWKNARYFEVNDEIVLQIPVYKDTDEQVQALIIAAIRNNFLDCYVVERNKFDKFVDHNPPQLTLEKVIDLFMLADFKVFDRSDYWPNGRVYYGPSSVSQLKGSAEVWEICYHQEGWVGNEKVSHSVTCEYEIRYVEDTRVPFVNGSSGGGGGTSYNGFKPTSGNPEDSDNDNVPDINDGLLNYPCASRILLSFGNFNSTISGMLRNVFDIDTTVNINFVPDASLINSGLDGTCSPMNQSFTDFEIKINTDVLNNSTQEYILATFAHESLHALINYYKVNDNELSRELFPLFFDPNLSGSDPDLQYFIQKQEHETMAKKYINAIADVIQCLNPSFPRSKAENLAWGGLQGTWIYELNKKASMTDPVGNNIFEKSIIETNTAERANTVNAVGTPC